MNNNFVVKGEANPKQEVDCKKKRTELLKGVKGERRKREENHLNDDRDDENRLIEDK